MPAWLSLRALTFADLGCPLLGKLCPVLGVTVGLPVGRDVPCQRERGRDSTSPKELQQCGVGMELLSPGSRFLGWGWCQNLPVVMENSLCWVFFLSQHLGHLWVLSPCAVVPSLFREAAASSLNANLPLQHL